MADAAEITLERLREMVPGLPLTRASAYAQALNAVREPTGLNTPIRVRHFLAQVAHETGGFRGLVENLNYKDPQHLNAMFRNVQGLAHAERLIKEGPQAIGCCIYANKLGNGGLDSGDGYKYRGRGFLMITGKANYAEVQRYSQLPVVTDPDQLGQAEPAATAAGRFWTNRHINAAADEDDLDEITRVVNGPAKNGLESRRTWLHAAQKVWP